MIRQISHKDIITRNHTMTNIYLPIPKWFSNTESNDFLCWVSQQILHPDQEVKIPESLNSDNNRVACLVITDLINQGWNISCNDDHLIVSHPLEKSDLIAERQRIRNQELIKRNEYLGRQSVRQFIERMETKRRHGFEIVSIFNLMRDGDELAQSIRSTCYQKTKQELVDRVISPYVQIVNSGERCVYTGIKLTDIWRYFRLTWTNQYTRTPGRTIMILVRDAAAPFHPIIGIAALGSPVMQLKERDSWIGWQKDEFLNEITSKPTKEIALWVWQHLDKQLDEIYLADLQRDGLYADNLWNAPTDDAISKLEEEAKRSRSEHLQRENIKTENELQETDVFIQRATTPLFRSKRCQALAGLLRSRAALLPYFSSGATPTALSAALSERESRDAIAAVLRKARGDAVGTEMADLTVCGAVAPYNELLGGKLVAMLAASPTVVRAYAEKYGGTVSEIASSMAGRKIVRRNQLTLLTTTNLYGTNSSQYNRIVIPGIIFGGHSPIEYRRVGRSVGFGTSHFSSESIEALEQLAVKTSGERARNVFGEGSNPTLRKIRNGLASLGWPHGELLKHGRQRIIYCIPLISNLLPYLIGLDTSPMYNFNPGMDNDIQKIVAWWAERWAQRRITSKDVLQRIASHGDPTVSSGHGARVTLPAP